MTDFSQAREYGPVNKVQITMTGIEDATIKEDSESIRINGIQTVTINDNYFLGTIDAREYAINGLWNALYNMKYTPIKTSYLGFPYLEMGDLIEVVLPDGTTVESFVFNYTFTYNGGYMGTLETPTISRTQETYPTNSIDDKVSKIGVNVDRANAEISAIVEDVSGVQAELNLKLDRNDNDQIISMINASADVITLNSNRLIINSTNFSLSEDGNIRAVSGDVGGFTLGETSFSANVSSKRLADYTYTNEDLTRIQQIILGNITPTYEDYLKYDFDNSGQITTSDYLTCAQIINGTVTGNGTFVIDTLDSDNAISLINSSSTTSFSFGIFGSYIGRLHTGNIWSDGGIYSKGGFAARNSFGNSAVDVIGNNGYGQIWLWDSLNNLRILIGDNDESIAMLNSSSEQLILLKSSDGSIKCVSLTQTSKEEDKKDFKIFNGALEELKNIDIYQYHFKNEHNEDKKHLGFVIGDKYNYSKKVTSKDNDGVDVYGFVSLCCQAIKEQQDQIEILKSKIEKLERK